MPTDDSIDLSNCDREPVHQLGAIQSFGCLLAIGSDWVIARASENVIDFLGAAAGEIIGAPLQSLVAHDAFQTLRQAVAQLRDTETLARHFALSTDMSPESATAALAAAAPEAAAPAGRMSQVPAVDIRPGATQRDANPQAEIDASWSSIITESGHAAPPRA